MPRDDLERSLTSSSDETPSKLRLEDGSTVAVVGGGPAGSFFAYFLLDMAERVGIEIDVDIYEPKSFSESGPGGCNHCGGILSESLVQALAAEGINMPSTVVQRGIDSYVLHMDVGTVHIETPLQEKRIGAVNRGSGPKEMAEVRWESFDAHLLTMATEKGARVVRGRVNELTWNHGRPRIKIPEGLPKTYDFLAVAVGVNSSALKMFQGAGLGYEAPRTVKTFIREYHFGDETIGEHLGSSMHVFLPTTPGIDFAAMIPKGDYTTLCLLGEGINTERMKSFLNSPEVKGCMPPGWEPGTMACRCGPRMNIQGTTTPFADRVVFVGDCGMTRLYKDGIGAAYRTAKAAASTAVFSGISAKDFERRYAPACRAIATDNLLGRIVFFVTHMIQKLQFSRRAVLRMTADEQKRAAGRSRRMSIVLWDTFTGSAPYREILLRTFHPLFLARFMWDNLVAIVTPTPRSERPAKPAD